jgi:hypothetical protein
VTNDRIANLVTLAADQDTDDSFVAGTLTYTLTTAEGGASPDFDLEEDSENTYIRVKRDTTASAFDFEGATTTWNLLLSVADDENASPEPIGVILSLSNVNEPPSLVEVRGVASETDDGGRRLTLDDVAVMETVCVLESYDIGGLAYLPISNGDEVAIIKTFDQDDGQETYLSITNEVPFVTSSGQPCDPPTGEWPLNPFLYPPPPYPSLPMPSRRRLHRVRADPVGLAGLRDHQLVRGGGRDLRRAEKVLGHVQRERARLQREA